MKHAASEADRAACMVQFARQVAETELLPSLTQGCNSAALTLEQLHQQRQHQQQQQQQQQTCQLAPGTYSLCRALMDAALVLQAFWPGKLLVGNTMAPCVEAVNRLACAMMRTPQTAAGSSSSSSSSSSSTSSRRAAASSSSSSSKAGPYMWLCNLVQHISDDISGVPYAALTDRYPRMMQRMASDTLLQLLLADIALAASLLHQQRSSEQAAATGRGDSKQPTAGVKAQAKQQKQQQQAPLPQPYHQKLLELLDMPLLQQLDLQPADVEQLQPVQAVVLLPFAWRARNYLVQPNSSRSSPGAASSSGSNADAASSSSSSADAASSSGSSADAAGSSGSSAGAAGSSGSSADAASSSSADAAGSSGSSAGAAGSSGSSADAASSSSSSASSIQGSIEAAACGPMQLVALELLVLFSDDVHLLQFGLQTFTELLPQTAEGAAVPEAAAALLVPVLTQLGPAVLQAASEAGHVVAADLQFNLLITVVELCSRVTPADLAAAMPQLPDTGFKTLEACIRIAMHHPTAAQHSAETAQFVEFVVKALISTDWQAASAGSVAAGRTPVTPPSAAPALSAAAGDVQQFALLASCLKAIELLGSGLVVAAAESGSCSEAEDKYWGLQTASMVAELCQSHTSRPWLLLEARALQVIGQVGQVAASLSIADAPADPADPAPAGEGVTVLQLLEGCIGSVEGLGPKLAAAGLQGQPAAAVEALQQLMQQQQDLLRQLQQAQQQQAQQQNSSSASTPRAAPAGCGALTAQLGQQLLQFGAAVRTQLPLQWWCNHPGCTNLDKLSELALVGGKACICAGCTVARYCSRSCQEAHWKKQHKPVCKRLAAAATTQQQK